MVAGRGAGDFRHSTHFNFIVSVVWVSLSLLPSVVMLPVSVVRLVSKYVMFAFTMTNKSGDFKDSSTSSQEVGVCITLGES